MPIHFYSVLAAVKLLAVLFSRDCSADELSPSFRRIQITLRRVSIARDLEALDEL